MNATDGPGFIARAIELGNDPAALAALRATLALQRERRNGLFDMAAFAAHFVCAAQTMRAG